MLRPGTKTLLLLAIALFGVAIAGCGSDDDSSGEHASFGYGEADGPARWASLDPAYEECDTGRRQSPVDLRDPAASPNPAHPEFAYETIELELENNGHSVEAVYPPGSTLELGGRVYDLSQFHFHAPSEHRIEGRSAPLEFHFVHEEQQSGGLLVLGVLVDEGRPNAAAAKLAEALPGADGEAARTAEAIDALDLLPAEPASARRWEYPGSLTTPPCSEGVEWHVFDRPVEFSRQQVEAFTDVYEGTNRPLQPLNGRTLHLTREGSG